MKESSSIEAESLLKQKKGSLKDSIDSKMSLSYHHHHRRHLLFILSLFLFCFGGVYGSPVSCAGDGDHAICVELQGEGSTCNKETGQCTNPYEQGCLYQRKPGWNRKRVCNSDDAPEDVGILCEESQFQDSYMEVRITSGGWESSFFNAWLLQILLSEMLGVPTTLEPGTYPTRINFYDTDGAVEYGRNKNIDSFANAFKYTDCRLRTYDGNDDTTNEDNYEPCSNLVPEFWSAQGSWAAASIADGSMEIPEALGVLAQETLFIPKFTAERDPSLLSYIGLQGEKNRQKLADRFLRPTLYKDYCSEVSLDNCTTPDNTTSRPPADEDEADSYYVPGVYPGYFRKTWRNFSNETYNATGHLIDYPCDWTSYAEQQFYHLGIPLSGDNYGEGQRGYNGRYLDQVLSAANATKSDIMIVWAKPDPYYQRLIGTDMELHPILFPPVTQECLANRAEDGCAADIETRAGDPRGVCEHAPISLHYAMSTSLTRATYDPDIKPAEESPAVNAIKLYRTSAPIYGSWFDILIERGALDPGRRTLLRDATCRWVVDNFDIMEQFVPFSYPRTIQDGESNTALTASSIALGSVAVLLVIVAAIIVYCNRSRRVMTYAQIDFLWLLLAGLLIMSIGALVAAIPPTNATCVTSIWFVNVGHTLELAPLLVKVSAINRLMSASRRLEKVKIERGSLFKSVMVITSSIVVYLIIWSAVDAPSKQGELTLTTETEETTGETIVYQTYYCSSESDVWLYIAFGWTGLLLLSSTVLAIQMRNVRQEFNESLTLGMMTYSHFILAVLRLVTFFLADSLGESDSARYRSILLSIDAIASLIIYFLPKFWILRTSEEASTSMFRNGNSQGSSNGQSSNHLESFRGLADAADLSNRDASLRDASSKVRFELGREEVGETAPAKAETANQRSKEEETDL